MDIHQLLYGYSNGHSLLSSSIELPVDDKSLLLELTDWSGVNELNTPTYITGFPLVKSNYYALVRTWYAEEMPRPGCVWSHVLLINKEYFNEITNIEKLINFFSRPALNTILFEDYNKPFALDFRAIDNQKYFSIPELKDSYIKKIIYNLYSTYDPIYLAPDSKLLSLEFLLLKLWWYQPINDRFLFSFCSGSFSPRKFLNKEIRLQVVAKESFRKQLSIYPTIEEETNFEPWVNTVYKELYSDSIKYVNFLNSISDDISPYQNKTIGLSHIFELINNEEFRYDSKSLVVKLLDSLAKFFPEKSEAKKLKRGLLSQSVLLSLKEEVFFLEWIVKIENDSSFDIDDLQIINRVIEIYHSDKRTFFELLNNIIKYNINEFGISIFTKSSTLIKESDISILVNNYWSLFTVYISIQPSLICYNESWNISDSQSLEIINLLLSKEYSNPVNWQFVLNKVFDKRVQLMPRMINSLQKVEPDYISIILDWYDLKPHREIQHIWFSELYNNSDKILDWIELKKRVNFSTMSLIVKLVNPNSKKVIDRGIELWIPFSESLVNNNTKESVYIHAFLTSIALNFNDLNAFKLLKNSFIIIYNEIANDTLDYNLSSMVLANTKPLFFWQEWDKCKKLRNALADKFNEAFWDTSLIIEIVNDYLLAAEIEELCKKRR